MGDRGRADQLLDAALHEFIENGYVAVGVKEITARAGVSHGTFYNYFDSKRALLSALTTRELADFIAIFDTAVEDQPRPCDEKNLRATLLAVNQRTLELFAERAEIVSFILIDVPGVDDDALAGHLSVFRALASRASAIFTAAVEDGVAPPDLHVSFAGQAWVSYLVGAGAPTITDGDDLGEAAAVAQLLTDVILYGVPEVVDA